uniref:Uncharacterized protein n=1 Tax=Cryptomonas curvata TaxID=233186 RepID=A0A7S0QEA4_9CRYP
MVEIEIQAASRRISSVQKARVQKSDHMIGIFFELNNTRKIADECTEKLRNSRNVETGHLKELRQKLDSLRGKEKRLAENLAQGFLEDKELFGEDLNFEPILTDLMKKRAQIRDQLKVCRELEAREQQISFPATISAIGHYIKYELLHSDCFGWNPPDQELE